MKSKKALNIDLHCHSTWSDGSLSPSALVHRAHDNGVHVLSLTDHDEIRGHTEAAQSAIDLNMKLISGVEISVTWASQTIHLLGYNIDIDNSQLLAGLINTRSGRVARGQEMGRQLDAVGIAGAFEGALKYVANTDLLSRMHFARYLVEMRICKDVRQVFMRYLTPGKPGYVPIQWASLADAMKWIKEAGGESVIAHPGRYKYSKTALFSLFDEFKQRGGAGIEVITGSHTTDQYQQFSEIATSYQFRASRGSDFHAPNESRIDLGALPALPDHLVPIWQDWF